MFFGGRPGRRTACVLLVTAVALALAASLALAVEPAPITCEVPTPASGPFGVTKDPSGNVWFVEERTSKVARVELATCKFKEIPLPEDSNPVAITLGPDGNMWVTERGSGKIARVPLTATKQSEVTEFSADNPEWITAGPEDDLWFTEGGADKIGRMTTAGAVTKEFEVKSADPGGLYLTWITTGPEGNLWFTDWSTSVVGKMTPAGAATGYRLPAESNPGGIVEGADENMWFTEESANKIGRITPKGKITEFNVPTGGSKPEYIARSSGGNLYFTEYEGDKIGRITPNGTITELPLPEGSRGPEGIADPSMEYPNPWIVTTLNDSNGIYALPLHEPVALDEPRKLATYEFKEWLEELEEGYGAVMSDATLFSPPGSKGLDQKDERAIAHALDTFEEFESEKVRVMQILADTDDASAGAFATLASLQAEDPPRYDFQRFASASASSPRLPASLTRRAPRAVVSAANAVIANASSFRSDAAALLTTFERLQGAFGDGNGEAEAAQAAHGVALADKEAALIAAAQKLDARLISAVRRKLHARHVSAAALRRLSRTRRSGLAPEVASLLRKMGLTAAQVRSDAKRVGRPRGSLTVPEFAVQKHLYKVDVAAAAKTRAFAAFLHEIAEGNG